MSKIDESFVKITQIDFHRSYELSLRFEVKISGLRIVAKILGSW